MAAAAVAAARGRATAGGGAATSRWSTRRSGRAHSRAQPRLSDAQGSNLRAPSLVTGVQLLGLVCRELDDHRPHREHWRSSCKSAKSGRNVAGNEDRHIPPSRCRRSSVLRAPMTFDSTRELLLPDHRRLRALRRRRRRSRFAAHLSAAHPASAREPTTPTSTQLRPLRRASASAQHGRLTPPLGQPDHR